MIYTVIVNDQSYDLPAKTINTMEKLEEVLLIDRKPLTIKQKYQKAFDFIKGMIKPEDITEIFGSDKLADIDVGELELLILKIQDAYNQAVEDYKAEKIENSLGSIPADKLKAITEAANAITQAEKIKK